MKNCENFMPSFLLRGTRVQTILASSRIRAMGKNPMTAASEEMIIDAGNGIRLQGFFSPAGEGSKGIVIMIHGWEGSSDSVYIRCAGKYCFEHGYDLFRINLRDHGSSHHLNEGLFFATFLDEMFNAVKYAAGMKSRPAFLVGFSMGGNFALRIAGRCFKYPIKNLKHVIAVSPALNPSKATDAIDSDFLMRSYFLKKWKGSLLLKQGLFPETYDFSSALRLKTCRAVTEVIVEEYIDYNSAEEYFHGYAVTDDILKDIAVPTAIITSKDDAVIPVEDFYGITVNDLTELIIHSYGGHNGFIQDVCMRTWYEPRMVNIFSKYLE